MKRKPNNAGQVFANILHEGFASAHPITKSDFERLRSALRTEETTGEREKPATLETKTIAIRVERKGMRRPTKKAKSQKQSVPNRAPASKPAAVLRPVKEEVNTRQLQSGTFAVCPLKDFKKVVEQALSGFGRVAIVLDDGYDAFRTELEKKLYLEIARQVRIANPTPPKVPRGTMAIPTDFDESELGDCLMYVLLKHCPPELVLPEGVRHAASVIANAINRITTSSNAAKPKSESPSNRPKQ